MDNILRDVNDYYDNKLTRHGATHLGVDWNSRESQELRFEQLLRVIAEEDDAFTILDYGCGYGALFDYLKARKRKPLFTGFDSSNKMISQARRSHPEPHIKWTSDFADLTKYDYVVASGIFNVRLEYSVEEWSRYVREIIDHFDVLSLKGFSFNALTSYSDKEFMRDDLYYADPCELFDFCKRNFSRWVSLIHDYPLYEFTLLVRK